jgi:hypothetical protein
MTRPCCFCSGPARLLVVVVVCLAGLVSADARAVSPTAETLFQEGRRLLMSGNTAEACARLGESFALEASSGTLLNLALCHEKLGRTASALDEYRDAALLARRQGRADRAAVAERKGEALRSRLSRLTIPEIPTMEREPHEPAVVPVRPRLDARPLSVGVLSLPNDSRPATRSGRPSVLEISALAGGGVLALTGGVLWTIAYAQWKSARSACNETPGGCMDFDRRVAKIATLKGIAIGSWAAAGALVTGTLAYYELHRSKDTIGVAFDPLAREFSLRATF